MMAIGLLQAPRVRADNTGAADNSAATQPSEALPIAGKWKGLICNDPTAGIIELDLQPGKEPGEIAGQVKTYPAVGKTTVLRDGQINQSTLRGHYDDLSRGLSIIYYQHSLGGDQAIRAVLDPQSGELIGVRDFEGAFTAQRAKTGSKATTQDIKSIDEGGRATDPFPFCVLARGDQGDEMVAHYLVLMTPAPRATPVRAPRPARPGARNGAAAQNPAPANSASGAAQIPATQPVAFAAPSIDQLIAWAAPLHDQSLIAYKVKYFGSLQQLRYQSNLFTDDYFTKYFGKPYDQLAASDLRAIAAQFRARRPPAGDPPVAQDSLYNTDNVYAGLWPRFSTPPSGPVIVSLLWNRQFPRWIDDTRSRLASMPAEVDSFAQIDFIEATARALLWNCWPDQRAVLAKSITDTRTRIADPVLTMLADQLIANSKSAADLATLAGWKDSRKDILQYATPDGKTQVLARVDARLHELAAQLLSDGVDRILASASGGLAGAQSLAKSKWLESQKSILKYAPSDEEGKLHQRIRDRVDQLIQPFVAQDVLAIPNLGRGLSAVRAGNTWYAQFMQKYGFAGMTPAMAQATKTLAARRPDDLAGAAPAIMADIAKQTDGDALDGMMGDYFQIPGDASTQTYKTAKAAADVQAAKIQVTERLAMYSDDERKWLKPDGTLAPPDPLPAPDADDLRVAVIRTMCRMGGQRVGPNTLHYCNNPIAAAMNIYWIVTVEKVDLLKCRPDPGGFVVDYRVHATFEPSKNIGDVMNSDNSLAGSMMQGMLDSMNGPSGMQTARFEFANAGSYAGWWCPTMLNPPVQVQVVPQIAP
jgi:hypothetical protein